MAKITAIISGSCYDCSVDHLVIPEGLDFEEVNREWQRWYTQQYMPGLRGGNVALVKFKSVIDLMIEKGARVPTADEFEEISR